MNPKRKKKKKKYLSLVVSLVARIFKFSKKKLSSEELSVSDQARTKTENKPNVCAQRRRRKPFVPLTRVLINVRELEL